ncbi:hypothetical protein Poli38472_010501 [Pythium oligandrum]|uniref:ABC transporter domain-containing protein n=1 Tax=Pythium oligandrum TaxID=41045 RepID=A0A8K1FC99_PYTOL|nr:hypothetical protein Poli38472_010501 [Pythium oligandrum]|eukprot:TMW55619.1 hypothetical protein Poli38472_010501 [Pythium oligandrum]
MTSSSASDASYSLLSACLENVFARDLAYAVCLMNSGLFELSGQSLDDNAPGNVGLVAALANTTASSQEYASTLLANGGNVKVGQCRLLCTDTSLLGASSSCCQAASNVHNCEPTTSSVASCKGVLEQAFGFDQQCGLSGENIGLVVGTVLVVILVLTMVILARKHARRQGKKAIAALEGRLAAGVATRWEAVMASWHQISNLVWKNVVLRRRKPVAFVFEQFLPVLLVGALVFLANLDNIFPAIEPTTSTTGSSEALFDSSTTLLCTALTDVNESDIGAPNETMTTFYTSGQTVLGMFLLISYIKFVSTTTTTMVIEKETRIREVMKIMGLSDLTLLFSWTLTSALLSTPLAFVIAAELKFGNVFPGAEYATLVFLFWSFSMSIVAFSYFITPFFNKSRTASIASVLMWLILYFPFFSVQSKSNSTKYAAALSPPTAFALAVDELLRRAQLGTGYAYSIGILENPITAPTAFKMTWMLLLDSLILFLLGWYLEQVLPQQYGVRKPWNFILKKEFWWPPTNDSESLVLPMVASPTTSGNSPQSDYMPVLSNVRRLESMPSSDDGSVIMMKEQNAMNYFIEPVNAALASQERKGSCLQIRDLRKVFRVEDGEKVAVHRLNLTLYSGQITALLGHNGAGKTTTISMLTGLITPTSGDATLYGRSIRHDFNELRQIMGICPQHDVLFNDLTVEEHLKLFGTMKNVPPQSLREELDKIIRDVGLTEKRKVQAKNLSGGQKRKLSVALAFIGDSKLVFLDEPTSGMDPYSRRFTWNLLQRNRDDRVIVLTTHFMDEADILGDRIAIMADGQLCCAGSSLFLKNRYGAGYNLTMIKAPHCDVEGVGRFLRKYVTDVKCLSSYGSEVVYQLPSAASGTFPTMLQALDQQMRTLGIQQYGVSVTTLEEVFLRIARDREEGGLAFAGAGPGDQYRRTSTSTAQTRPTTGRIATVTTDTPTFAAQYGALLKKRLRITKRDRKSLLNAVCIPLLFLIILALLPEINVSNFLPDYSSSIASEDRQANCTARNFTAVTYTETDQSNCLSSYSYCSLGVIDCNPTACCTQKNPESPYYPCNTCTPRGTSPCYNQQCLARDGVKLQVTLNAFLVAVVVMLAFAFIPASIVAFIVREKNPIQNAKSLQLICGANVSAYWFSNWTHDIILIFVSVVAAVIVVPLSNRALSGATEIIAIAALVASHAIAVVPLAYLFSFRFSKHAVAQTSLLVFALSTGGLLSIFSFLCRIVDFNLAPKSDNGLTLSALDRNYLRWIFMFFPGYSLNNGIYEIATRKISRGSLFGDNSDVAPASFFGLFEGLGKQSCTECWNKNVDGCCVRDVFDWDVGGAPILYGLFEALVFTSLVFLIENRSIVWKSESFKTQHVRHDEDEDVALERLKIQHTQPSRTDSIFIRNLRQQYKGGKVALDDLCLSIPRGECFGYLGINGAGKSTTMKVLTGQIAPTNGFVSLGGYDLSRFRDKARTVLGYCPQFDSLHDLLTVEEQLELYARLKGIPRGQIRLAVDQKITEVGLNEYRDKLTRGLSGGNKRKVSTAIALMGAPRIIFLDEPSTGVDPSSRRKMWDVIAAVCAEKDSCVVLTTHSMEECEALCTRVGILVSGKLKCLGSVEHLKQKFGRGYTVEVKLAEPSTQVLGRLEHKVTAILGQDIPIDEGNLVRLCAALGAEERGRNIINNHDSGWVLNAVLVTSGFIPIDVFCSWWASENMSQSLQSFFASNCTGSKLVEHQGDHFRFQVPKHAQRPFQIFGLLEECKARLNVNEYSVSDTSLEHIFNNMAAQQDEERLVANGMYDDANADYQQYGYEPSSLQSVRSYHRSSSLRSSSSRSLR